MMPLLFITHGLYSTPLLFYSALLPHFTITSVGVSRPGKVACFSDAQLRSLTPRSSDPRPSCWFHTTRTFVRTSRRLARGQPI